MKVAYAVSALVLAANDVDPRWVAWMIAGMVLLAATAVVLVAIVRQMIRKHDVARKLIVWASVIGGLAMTWVAVGWPAGWV